MTRARHLERGWCWRCDVDGDPAVWGIVGHVDSAEAAEIVTAYEGEPIAPTSRRRWYVTVDGGPPDYGSTLAEAVARALIAIGRCA